MEPLKDEQVVNEEGVGDETITATMRVGLGLMSSWREEVLARSKSRPPVLFHYTGSEALTGIVSTNQLWATNAVFMNDQSEIWHTASLLATVLEEPINEAQLLGADESCLKLAQESMLTVLRYLHNYVEAYAFCFCSEPDLLSQWRGYGDGSGRYSIGFRSSDLDDVGAGPTQLIQVIYDDGLQIQLMRELVKRWRLMYLESMAEDSRTKNHVEAMLFAQMFAWLAVSFKNKGFEEEREWRIVYLRPRLPETLPDESFEFHFRSIGGISAPYVRFERPVVDEKVGYLPIDSIHVGPHRYPELAMSGIWHLLAKYRPTEEIAIEKSATPLRT